MATHLGDGASTGIWWNGHRYLGAVRAGYVGGWLHGYGGGGYAVSGGRTAWLTGGTDSGLYRLDLAMGALEAVRGGAGFLYGNLRSCPAGLLAVRAGEGGDEIILVDHGGGVGDAASLGT